MPAESDLLTLPDIRVIFEVGCDSLSVTSPDLRAAYPEAEYYAFDADPRNAAIVARTKADERLNIKFFPIGISSKPGSFRLYQSTSGATGEDDWNYSSSLHKPTVMRSEAPGHFWFEDRGIDIPCETLDNICAEHGVTHIDLLHIDVQSAEMEVLLGAANILPQVHFIFMEVNTGGVYSNETSLQQRMELLPGWRLVKHYAYDALLENTRFTGPQVCGTA